MFGLGQKSSHGLISCSWKHEWLCIVTDQLPTRTLASPRHLGLRMSVFVVKITSLVFFSGGHFHPNTMCCTVSSHLWTVALCLTNLEESLPGWTREHQLNAYKHAVTWLITKSKNGGTQLRACRGVTLRMLLLRDTTLHGKYNSSTAALWLFKF